MAAASKTAFTVWVTGLPASGKRALALEVARLLRARGRAVEVIDSGRLRQTPLGASLGFSRDDRETNVRRHALAAAMLTRNGVVAVISAVSPYRSTRDAIRAELGEFIEVWASTPPDACKQRDTSGNWARALAGELKGFTGVDAPYQAPTDPSAVANIAEESVEAAAARVLGVIDARGWSVPDATDEDSNRLAEQLQVLGYSD